MKKRILAFLLAFSMSTGGFGMMEASHVHAAKNAHGTVHTGAFSFVNPLYEDVINVNESDLAVEESSISLYADPVYETDSAAIVLALREAMAERCTEMTVYYSSKEELTEELLVGWIDGALEHTGNAKEGDYILFHYEKVNVKYSYYSDSDGSIKYTLVFTLSYYTDAEQEALVDEKVDDLIEELNITSEMSDYDKVKAVYDYLCENVTYDNANLYDETYTLKYSAYAALINNTAVCQGYSNSMYRILNEIGVDTRIVRGESNGTPHSWNLIDIDGTYYFADSTWDAGMSTYSYFLCGKSDFGNHTADSDFLHLYNIANSKYLANHEHSYSKVETKATCTEAGYTTYTCACGKSYVADEVEALGHAWDEGVVTKEPTDLAEGVRTYTCETCGTTKKEAIEKLEHKHSYSMMVTEPTCTKAGYTTYKCKCGDSYVADEVEAFGHTWGKGVVTKEPTETAEGVRTYTCETCGGTRTETIAKLEVTKLPFTDVPEDKWYYENVKYVYEQGLMVGITETSFEPDATLTRAMFAAILYRAHGEPEVEYEAIFTDVPDNKWYTDGIMWAYQNGILYGYGDGNVGTNDNITREQLAAMMYRYGEYMGYDMSARAELDQFEDIAETEQIENDIEEN